MKNHRNMWILQGKRFSKEPVPEKSKLEKNVNKKVDIKKNNASFLFFKFQKSRDVVLSKLNFKTSQSTPDNELYLKREIITLASKNEKQTKENTFGQPLFHFYSLPKLCEQFHRL